MAEAGRRAGCKEALFSLGDQPESIFPEAKEFLAKLGFERTLEYLPAMCELVLEKTGLLPHSNPGSDGRGRSSPPERVQRQHGDDARKYQPAAAAQRRRALEGSR